MQNSHALHHCLPLGPGASPYKQQPLPLPFAALHNAFPVCSKTEIPSTGPFFRGALPSCPGPLWTGTGASYPGLSRCPESRVGHAEDAKVRIRDNEVPGDWAESQPQGPAADGLCEQARPGLLGAAGGRRPAGVPQPQSRMSWQQWGWPQPGISFDSALPFRGDTGYCPCCLEHPPSTECVGLKGGGRVCTKRGTVSPQSPTAPTPSPCARFVHLPGWRMGLCLGGRRQGSRGRRPHPGTESESPLTRIRNRSETGQRRIREGSETDQTWNRNGLDPGRESHEHHMHAW